MGCDIHSYAEFKDEKGQWQVSDFMPFDSRDYGTFAFLAGVRNYSNITPISNLRGIPEDAAKKTKKEYKRWGVDGHSASWLNVEELLSFDYDTIMEDCRCTVNGNGGSTCEKGQGTAMPYREFLGKWFFEDLEKLKIMSIERIVFWFDN